MRRPQGSVEVRWRTGSLLLGITDIVAHLSLAPARSVACRSAADGRDRSQHGMKIGAGGILAPDVPGHRNGRHRLAAAGAGAVSGRGMMSGSNMIVEPLCRAPTMPWPP